MVTFFSNHHMLFLILGASMLITGWMASITYLSTLYHSIPVVIKIRNEGGIAPSVKEIKRFFLTLSLIMFIISLLGSFLTYISIYKIVLNESPNTINDLILNFGTVLNMLTKKELIVLGLILIAMCYLVKVGYKQGIASTLATQR